MNWIATGVEQRVKKIIRRDTDLKWMSTFEPSDVQYLGLGPDNLVSVFVEAVFG